MLGQDLAGTAAAGARPGSAPRSHCGAAALEKPVACPAALLRSFPQQKGSDYNKTLQKTQGRGQGTVTGGTQSTRESLGSTAQFIKLLSGAPRTYSVYGGEGRGLKYLADLCDLGLQVHHVESQTMFELPSVTINIGDERAWKNLAARALRPRLLSSEQHSQPGGGSSTSPHSSQCCFPAGIWGIKPPDGGRRGQPRLGVAEGRCLEPGREPQLWAALGAQPQRAALLPELREQLYKGKGLCSGLPMSYFLLYLVY